MVELLLVIAILGILLAIGTVALRAPSPRLAANDYKALLQEGRSEAVKRNRAVFVRWEPSAQALVVTAATTSGSATCGGSSVELKRLGLDQYRDVTFHTDMPSAGMVWLPNGRSRQCDGSLTATETTFAGPNVTYAVLVSSVGEVRVETR